jgi:alpha,alpha-trehalase
MIPRNVAYYGARTSHGSTLSRVVDAWVLARSDRPRSWRLFTEAIESDVADIQGGTTSEGIHLGAMAGTVDLMQRCYTGIEVRDGRLWLNPQLPDELKRLCIRLRFRGQTLALAVSHSELEIRAVSAHLGSIRLQVGGRGLTLQPGDARVLSIADMPVAVEGAR